MKPAFWLLSFAVAYVGVTKAHAQSNTFPAAGNVGIGTGAPNNKLAVVESLTNPSQRETSNVEQRYAISANDVDYIKALDIEKYWYDVPAGVTAEGYQIGLASQVFVSDPNFQGTIDRQWGLWSRTGINVAGSTGPRTINQAVGLYLEGLSGAGTVLNHYGIYQEGSGTKNYFGGNVGIGTNMPEQRLQVVGGRLQVNTAAPWDNFQIYTDGYSSYLEANGDEGGLFIRSNLGGRVIFDRGNVGIGTTTPSHKLSVNGTIKAKEVIVETSGWADDVFAPGYVLLPLDSIEEHIAVKGHLPGIPSATEAAEQGVSVGEMQAALLRKVEELTLYLIETRKENAELRRRLEVLEAAR